MAAAEPLIKIVRTGFPYSLLAILTATAAMGLVAKISGRGPFWASALGQLGPLICFTFVILAFYLQISSPAMSFMQLVPASFFVSIVVIAIALIRMRSEWNISMTGMAATLAVFSVCMTIFLAAALTIVPALILLEWAH